MVNSLIPTLQSVPLHSPTVSTSTAVKSLYGVQISEWLLLIGIYLMIPGINARVPWFIDVLMHFMCCKYSTHMRVFWSATHVIKVSKCPVWIIIWYMSLPERRNHQCIRTYLYVNLNHPLASSILVTYDSPHRFVVFWSAVCFFVRPVIIDWLLSGVWVPDWLGWQLAIGPLAGGACSRLVSQTTWGHIQRQGWLVMLGKSLFSLTSWPGFTGLLCMQYGDC